MKANQDFFRPTQKIVTHAKNCDPRKDPRKKFWIHAKKFDPRKNIIDPRNPRKNYDLRKMLTQVKNILTHVTHAAHVKF